MNARSAHVVSFMVPKNSLFLLLSGQKQHSLSALCECMSHHVGQSVSAQAMMLCINCQDIPNSSYGRRCSQTCSQTPVRTACCPVVTHWVILQQILKCMHMKLGSNLSLQLRSEIRPDDPTLIHCAPCSHLDTCMPACRLPGRAANHMHPTGPCGT